MEPEIHLKPFVRKKSTGLSYILIFQLGELMSGVQTTGTEFFFFQETTNEVGRGNSNSRGVKYLLFCPLEDFLDECIKTD